MCSYFFSVRWGGRRFKNCLKNLKNELMFQIEDIGNFCSRSYSDLWQIMSTIVIKYTNFWSIDRRYCDNIPKKLLLQIFLNHNCPLLSKFRLTHPGSLEGSNRAFDLKSQPSSKVSTNSYANRSNYYYSSDANKHKIFHLFY